MRHIRVKKKTAWSMSKVTTVAARAPVRHKLFSRSECFFRLLPPFVTNDSETCERNYHYRDCVNYILPRGAKTARRQCRTKTRKIGTRAADVRTWLRKNRVR